MDFAQFVGRGWGPSWRGILFRQNYPNLEEVITKSLKWFKRVFPKAVYKDGKHVWIWPTGERLYFRHAAREQDYYNYHGHEFPWIAWEELTNWANDKLYINMMSVCRSSSPGMPRRYRATTNPYGVGHHWVKARFIDPVPRGEPFTGEDGLLRVAIHLERSENYKLLENDPDYVKRLQAQDGPKREAWLYGNWDLVAGDMFCEAWDPKVHIVRPFTIPRSWYIDRSFDWGSSKPYCVQWWAESDGTPIEYSDGTKRNTRAGDLFMIAENYGWNGKPNEGVVKTAGEIAEIIRHHERDYPFHVNPGPSDPSIFTVEDGNCVASNMETHGVSWTEAPTGPGSRVNGWDLMRERLKNVKKPDGERLFVFSTCRQFIRTFPALPRDEKNMDDVNTNAEDHAGDCARYRCLAHAEKAGGILVGGAY
jgi:hypothetical protein